MIVQSLIYPRLEKGADLFAAVDGIAAGGHNLTVIGIEVGQRFCVTGIKGGVPLFVEPANSPLRAFRGDTRRADKDDEGKCGD